MAQNVHNQRFYIINIGMFEDSSQEELKAVKAVEAFIAPYQPDRIIADAGYGKDRNTYLLRKFSPRGEGRFWACWYNPSKTSRTFQPGWSSPEQARVLIDRTMSIRLVCQAIKERDFGIPDLGLDLVDLLKQHYMHLAPFLHIEEEGEEPVEEIRATGDDHLVHANLYAWLGIEQLTRRGRFSYDFL
jgi:hypothetical protein